MVWAVLLLQSLHNLQCTIRCLLEHDALFSEGDKFGTPVLQGRVAELEAEVSKAREAASSLQETSVAHAAYQAKVLELQEVRGELLEAEQRRSLAATELAHLAQQASKHMSISLTARREMPWFGLHAGVCD